MTRLIQFKRSQYPDFPDWLNPDHIRLINFEHDLAVLRMTETDDIYVTADEAKRLICLINGDQMGALALPSPTEIKLSDQAAEHILKEVFASTKPRIAPEQPDTSLAAFKAMIRERDFVVLDTETTGLEDGEIVQIAIIDSDFNVLLDTLVKPKKPIPADATRIHGITDDMVKNAPTWETVRHQVQHHLEGRHCVIYNAVYDRKMMHKSSERWGLPKTEWKDMAAFWCAMEAYAEIHGDWSSYRQSYRWQKLSTAAARYGIEQHDAHTALDDCLTTLAVCKAMAGA